MALTLNGTTGLSGIAGSAGTPALQGNNDTNTGYFFATDTLGLSTAGSERLRIDSSGRLLVGHTSPTSVGVGAAYTMPLQVIGTSYDTAGIVAARYAANAFGPTLHFVKSRNATKGSQTIVQEDDTLGFIRWYGSDGADTTNAAAMISAEVDATPASDKIPGRLSFRTTDDLTYPIERLRIDSVGRLFINTTAVVNTDDFLTIKRPAGSHSVTSMTLDATTATGSYANALIFTKAKDYYYNGLIFTSNDGHQGGICGKMTTNGGSTPQIDVRVGGTSFGQSDVIAMSVLNGGNVSLPAGNLVIGTAGKGIDFSATSDAAGSTSELLSDYEEGTWTPANSTVGVENSTSSLWGYYQRTGNWVIANFGVRFSSNGSAIAAYIDGLPFTNVSTDAGGYRFGGYIFYTTTANAIGCSVGNNSSRIYIWDSTGTGVALTHFDDKYVRGTVILKVA